MFETLGSDLYKGMVADMKKFNDQEKPPKYHYIEPEEWDTWQVYWKRPEVEDQAYKNRHNRLSEPRDGKGSSRHHYGHELLSLFA